MYLLTIYIPKCMIKIMKNNIQNLTFTALMTAILCIMGPIVIPIGMVPMSLTNMAIYLAIILLDKKKAIISTAIYLLIGLVGIPVFSGFSAGAGKLLGPTGGYLMGYLVLSWIGGSILEVVENRTLKKSRADDRDKERKSFVVNEKMLKQGIALVSGTLGLYLFGTLWLMYQSKLNWMTALSVGVFPFLVFDAIKILLAVSMGNSIKKRISFLVADNRKN